MHLRRLLLVTGCAALLAPSCAPGFDPPSKVEALRIIAVDADEPYAHPGDTVTLSMTVADGIDPASPRALQILWIGGCVDPQGDEYFLCFQQLADLLGPLAHGGAPPPSDLVKLDSASAASDGQPNAHTFSLTVPADIVSRRPRPDAGPYYGIEYVLYAACAGRLAPAPLTEQNGQVPELPLGCLDEKGNPQGPDSFVPGYTQIYVFDDGRTNQNPPTNAVTLDGAPLPSDPTAAPIVAACPVSDDARHQAGCGKSGSTTGSCDQHLLSADVPDSAEVLPDARDENGAPLREVEWVSYFANGGDVDTSIKLVSDSRKGYQDDHSTTWIAPATPGLVSIWAVTRDQRGGESLARGFVRVR